MLRVKAAKLEREASHLNQVEGMEGMAEDKRSEAKMLLKRAEDLRPEVRLENLTVYQTNVQKKLADGRTKHYPVWRVSWRSGSKTTVKHLGSCSKMTKDQAMVKAKKLKADFLGL